MMSVKKAENYTDAVDYHLKMTDGTYLIINELPYRKITPEEFKKIVTEAINVKLQ